MATTFVDYTGDGNATKAFSFPSIQESDIKVKVDEVLKSSGTHYNITGYTTTGGGNVVFTSGNIPTSPSVIHIYRDTNVDSAKATYTAGASVKAGDLNANHEQVLFALQEEQNQLERIGDIKDGSIDSAKIKDDTIVNADVNSAAAIAGTKISPDFGTQNLSLTGNITVSGTVDGRDVSADGAKLDTIETAATADQTAAEIRTLVGNATDSNVFTDADHSKLDGIETAATADQTAAEIRTLVESASDSNVFTDADHTKLNGIETAATADQTAAEIRTLVESASDSNVFTDADHTKLNNIEANADVTDATNVNAAGAVMNSDLATKGTLIVGDGSGDPTILSVGQNNYVLVADSNEPSGVKWATVPAGSGLSNLVEDVSPQLGGALDVQAQEINTSTTNGNIKLNPNGTGVVEIKGDGSSADGTIQLNCSQNSHGVKIKSPAHSAGASYTLTLPTNIVNGQFLKTDTNGNLSWAAVDLTALSASNLTSGTVPDARFPATLPAASAANLTSIPAANITGTLPAIDGSNLTGIDTDLVSDTTPQLGGDLDVNGNRIDFATDKGLTLKTGATNAVVNGVTQHVQQGSLIIDGGNKDIFFTGGSQGSKFTFGSSDGLTHEVMRITPSVLGASQHGKVELKYVTANAGGSTSSSTKLSTTSTGVTVNGTVAATSYTGDGSNLTGVASTVAGGAIYENSQTISQTHTIPSGSNGMSAGPVSVSNGVTLTISSGSTYTVV